MPEMDGRRGFGFVVAIILAACVPTPTGRVTPAGSDTGEASGTTAAGPAVPAASSPPSSGAAGPTATPSFVRPTPNPGPTFLVYEVRLGDSLTSIARLFGTTARSISFWNRAQYPSLDPDSDAYEPNRMRVGWTLLLIPTEVVAEDELPDPTPTPIPAAVPSSPGASDSPS